MSHALSHALMIERHYGRRPPVADIAFELECGFGALGLGSSKGDRTNLKNLINLASYFNLDARFFSCHDGILCEENMGSPSVDGRFLAFSSILKMRDELFNEKCDVCIKHVFALFKESEERSGHVVLFSLIQVENEISIILIDNLNEQMGSSPLLKEFAAILAHFFHGLKAACLSVYRNLSFALSADEVQADGYLSKFEEYFDFDRQDNKDMLLEHLVTTWLHRIGESMVENKDDFDAYLFNPIIRLLKKLHRQADYSNASELLLHIYDRMITVIEFKEMDIEVKSRHAKSLQGAIKKSAREQNIFSLQHDSVAIALWDRINNLVSRLDRQL